MDIFATIQEMRPQFSTSEQRIAEILVNQLEFAVGASIIDLAGRAEVSPPTVTRFCRRLGTAVTAAAVVVATVSVAPIAHADPSTAAAAVEPATARVDTVINYQHAIGAGTGFVLDAGGALLTNFHVVQGADKVTALDQRRDAATGHGVACEHAVRPARPIRPTPVITRPAPPWPPARPATCGNSTGTPSVACFAGSRLGPTV